MVGRAIVTLLWVPVNLVQAVLVVFQLAFWVTVALVVRVLTRDTRHALGLARWAWAPGVLAVCGTRVVSVEGVDRIDWSKPYVIAANHQSFLDIPVLFHILPVNLRFVVKQELSKVPFLAWYIRAMGMVFVDRADPQKARRSIERVAAAAREHTFLLFPEGTRSLDGEVHRFKSGMLAAAARADAPILPVAIVGTSEGIPRTNHKIRPTRVRVAVGEPIETADYGLDDRRRLADDVRAEVAKLHAGLRSKNEAGTGEIRA